MCEDQSQRLDKLIKELHEERECHELVHKVNTLNEYALKPAMYSHLREYAQLPLRLSHQHVGLDILLCSYRFSQSVPNKVATCSVHFVSSSGGPSCRKLDRMDRRVHLQVLVRLKEPLLNRNHCLDP